MAWTVDTPPLTSTIPYHPQPERNLWTVTGPVQPLRKIELRKIGPGLVDRSGGAGSQTRARESIRQPSLEASPRRTSSPTQSTRPSHLIPSCSSGTNASTSSSSSGVMQPSSITPNMSFKASSFCEAQWTSAGHHSSNSGIENEDSGRLYRTEEAGSRVSSGVDLMYHQASMASMPRGSDNGSGYGYPVQYPQVKYGNPTYSAAGHYPSRYVPNSGQMITIPPVQSAISSSFSAGTRLDRQHPQYSTENAFNTASTTHYGSEVPDHANARFLAYSHSAAGASSGRRGGAFGWPQAGYILNAGSTCADGSTNGFGSFPGVDARIGEQQVGVGLGIGGMGHSASSQGVVGWDSHAPVYAPLGQLPNGSSNLGMNHMIAAPNHALQTEVGNGSIPGLANPTRLFMGPNGPIGLSEFAADMFCHLWFMSTSSPVFPHSRPLSPRSPLSCPSSPDHNPFAFPNSTSNPTTLSAPRYGYAAALDRKPAHSPLQTPSLSFRAFVNFTLNATLVPDAVVFVALLYVWKLRVRHPNLVGAEGSEFRLCGTSLMLANKVLDDNTYINSTWAHVTGIPLVELNNMEIEMLSSLNYDVVVRNEPYETWLETLRGLVSDRKEYPDIAGPGRGSYGRPDSLAPSPPFLTGSAGATFPTSWDPSVEQRHGQSTNSVKHEYSGGAIRNNFASENGQGQKNLGVAKMTRRASNPYATQGRRQVVQMAHASTPLSVDLMGRARSLHDYRTDGMAPAQVGEVTYHGTTAETAYRSPLAPAGAVPPPNAPIQPFDTGYSMGYPSRNQPPARYNPSLSAMRPGSNPAASGAGATLSSGGSRAWQSQPPASGLQSEGYLCAPYRYQDVDMGARKVAPTDLAYYTLAASPVEPLEPTRAGAEGQPYPRMRQTRPVMSLQAQAQAQAYTQWAAQTMPMMPAPRGVCRDDGYTRR